MRCCNFSDYILTRNFFVRQFKGLEGYILICRGSFGLYNRKRNLKSVCEKIVHSGFCSLGTVHRYCMRCCNFSDYILTRNFFVRQFKGLEGYILICRGSFGLYNRKRNLKSVCEKIVHSGFCSLGAVHRYCPKRKMRCGQF